MKLSNNKIQNFINLLENTLSPLNIKEKNKIRMRLSLEEALLRYKDYLGEDAYFSYKINKRFFAVLVEISVEGRAIDVLHPELGENASTNMLDDLFNNDESQILYSYKNGINIISISMPLEAKKLKFPGPASLHAILLGVPIGIFLKAIHPDSLTILIDSYISPVYSTMMNALKGLMEPIIFISLVIGICAFDDLKTLSSIGKKTLLSFLCISTSMYVLTVLTCFFVFPSVGASAERFNPADILELLLTSVPTSIVAPFYEGNMIQIVALGFVSGIVILMLGEKANNIRQFVLEIKFFLFTILEMFTKLLPMLVCLSVIKVILTTDVSDSLTVWKIIAVDQILVVITAIVCLAYASFRTKTPIKVLAKKIFPLFNVALTTGSSTAVIPEFYKRLPANFGIDEKFSNYWIPLSNAFFSPAVIIALIVYTFFSAQMQGIGITFSWLIILYILIIQIGMATPRIPGGIIVSCTILFSQLGMSTDQLGIIMAANVLILYLDTAVATVVRCCNAIHVAIKKGYIDLHKLRDENI